MYSTPSRLLEMLTPLDEYMAVVRNLKSIFRFLLERARFTGTISDSEYENSVEEERLADDPSGFLTRHMLAYTNNGRFLRYESWKKNGRERFRAVPVLSKYRTTWDDVRKLHKSVAKKLQAKDPAYKVVNGYVELLAEAFAKDGALGYNTAAEKQDTPESGDRNKFNEERLMATTRKDQSEAGPPTHYDTTSPEHTDDQTNSMAITVNTNGTVSMGMGDYLRIRKAKYDGSARSRLQIQQLESSFRWAGERGRVTLEHEEAAEVRESMDQRPLSPKAIRQPMTPDSFTPDIGTEHHISLHAPAAAHDKSTRITGSKECIAPEVIVLSDDDDEETSKEESLVQQPPPQQQTVRKVSRKPYIYKRKRPPGTKVTSAELLHESTLDDLRAFWGRSTPSADDTSIGSQVKLLETERQEVAGSLASLAEESSKTNDAFASRIAKFTSPHSLSTTENVQAVRRLIKAHLSYTKSRSTRQLELNKRIIEVDGELEMLKAQDDKTEAKRPDSGRVPVTVKASDTLQARLEQAMMADTVAVRMTKSVFEWASTQENTMAEEPKKRKKPLRKRKNW